jgi:hypothetical protein
VGLAPVRSQGLGNQARGGGLQLLLPLPEPTCPLARVQDPPGSSVLAVRHRTKATPWLSPPRDSTSFKSKVKHSATGDTHWAFCSAHLLNIYFLRGWWSGASGKYLLSFANPENLSLL